MPAMHSQAASVQRSGDPCRGHHRPVCSLLVSSCFQPHASNLPIHPPFMTMPLSALMIPMSRAQQLWANANSIAFQPLSCGQGRGAGRTGLHVCRIAGQMPGQVGQDSSARLPGSCGREQQGVATCKCNMHKTQHPTHQVMAPVFFVLEGKGEALHPNLGQPARRRLKQLHSIALAPDRMWQRALEGDALHGRGEQDGSRVRGRQAGRRASRRAGGWAGAPSKQQPAQQDENVAVNSGER